MATIRVKNPNLGGEKWITIPTKILSEADHIVTNKGQGDLYLSNDGTYKDVIKSANDYTDKLIELITGSSPDILETLKELSNQTSDNKDFINVLNKSIATKLDKTANAVSASKLATPIKLWGNDFDGSLSVYGNLCAPNGNLGLDINANNVVLGNNTNPSYIYGSSVMFKTGTDAVAAYISSDGKVGIGTANPLVGFHVNVNSYFDYPIKVSGEVSYSSPLLKLDATNTDNNGLLVLSKSGNPKAAIGVDDTYGMWFLNLSNLNIFRITSNSLTYGSNKIWHEGNFNPSDYLPLSGGKISGALYTDYIYSFNSAGMLSMHPSDWQGVASDQWGVGHYGSEGVIRGKNNLLHFNGTHTYKVWTEGNDGSDSGLDADMLDGYHSGYFAKSLSDVGANNTKSNILGYTYSIEAHGGASAGGLISAGMGTHGMQLNGAYNGNKLSFRGFSPDGYTDWKTIAFTDYNGFYDLYGGTRILPSANNIVDLNNYKTVGTYHVMQYSDTLYVENMPERNSFILHVVACNGVSLYYLKQIFQPYNSAKEYVRFYPASSGRWSEWWLSNDDLNTYNAPTATDADMLDGKHGKAYQKAVYEYIIPEGTHDETAKKLDDTTIPNVVGYGSWNEYDFGFVDTKFYQDLNTSKVRIQISYGVRTNNAWMRNFNDKTQLWSDWRAFAFVDSNVASATKLKTPIKIWGNDFDGSSDVNGTLNDVGFIYFNDQGGNLIYKANSEIADFERGLSFKNADDTGSGYIGAYGEKGVLKYLFLGKNYTNTYLTALPNGNIGIGTIDPQYKLDINGRAHFSGSLYAERPFMLLVKNDTDEYSSVLNVNSTGDVTVGYGSSEVGEFTNIDGTSVNLRYGTAHTKGLILNSSGNVTIGDSDLAKDQYSLRIKGKTYIGEHTPGDDQASYLNINQYIADLYWAIHVKNSYVYENSLSPGVGIKLALGANNESYKWIGIAAVSESTYSNNVGLSIINNNTNDESHELMRIDSKGNVFPKHNVASLTLGTPDNSWHTVYATLLVSSPKEYGIYMEGRSIMIHDNNNSWIANSMYFGNSGNVDFLDFVTIKNYLTVNGQIKSGELVDWYGVSWSEDSSDPTCTRIGNMALHRSLPILNAMRLYAISVHGAAVQNIILPFDDNMNIKYDTLSNYASGVTDETPIATMVKIPEFWYIDDYEPTTKTHNLKISQTAKAGWCHHKEAYVGAYEGYHDGTYYRSTKNAVPTVSKTREQLRTAARANGYEDEYKWNIYTYEEHRAICHLFLVEYATRNSQAPVNTALTADGFKQGGLGPGCTTGVIKINGVDTYSFIPTGTTDSLGNGSGQVAYTIMLTDADGNEIGTVTSYANRYRGIENPFGHIWKHVDDIVNVYNAETTYKTVYKCNKPEHFATNKNAKYKPLCSFPGGSKMQGWSKEIKATINCDFFKYSVGGSRSTYWCDYNYDNDDTSEHCLLIGGRSGNSGNAGLFCLDLNSGVGLSFAGVGSRLTYLPWAE